jgi:serine/threonine-protein phosphatase 2A regulatory subunit A
MTSAVMPITRSTSISLLPAPGLPLARSLPRLTVDHLKQQSAFQLFQLQLESGSLEAAVDAMHRLVVVAQSMTPPEITDELLPYLTQSVALVQPPLADELLLLLGQNLSKILKLIPLPQLDCLTLLERLAAVEETVVREQAVQVVIQICETLPATTSASDTTITTTADDTDNTPNSNSNWHSQVISPLVGVVKRLASADWFTAKVSACGILPAVVALVNTVSAQSQPQSQTTTTTTEELLAIFKEQCQDETPMVRRAAALNLGKVLKACGWTYVELILPMLPLLVQDEQDSVRRLAVASLADVGLEFGREHPEWTVQHWLPLVKNGSTDMSWYVSHSYCCICCCAG